MVDVAGDAPVEIEATGEITVAALVVVELVVVTELPEAIRVLLDTGALLLVLDVKALTRVETTGGTGSTQKESQCGARVPESQLRYVRKMSF